jgi:symplekin
MFAVDMRTELTADIVEDARPMASKYLSKYRPQFLENATKENKDSPTPAPAGTAITT